MAPSSDENLVARMAYLREQFVRRAGPDLARVSAGLRAAASRGQFGDLAYCYQLLHRLAGSAGTFGYENLGRQARVLEKKLKPIAEKPDAAETDSPELRAVIKDDLLAGLARLSELLDLPPEPIAPPEVTAAGGLRQEQQQICVLVVGLYREVAAGLAERLSHYGFEVHILGTFEACRPWIEVEARASDNLVISDRKHVESVLALCRTRQEALGVPQVPVICVDEADDFDMRYRLADLGCEGFFTLPVDVPLLADRIERLIGERREVQTGRVLIVEDDAELAEHYRLVLTQAGIDVRLVLQADHLLAVLSEFRPDIVLMDVHMGRFSGVTLARLIRFQAEWLSLPIIYLSTEQDRHEQLDALAIGADEFMTKPVSDQHLTRSIRIRCYRARQLSRLVSRDSLTGLLKHSLIKQEVNKELARTQRLKHESTVAMLDLDHFKTVNDRFGHAVGDTVIKALANLLRQSLRTTDVLGRYGGEEFVVVLPECDVRKAGEILNDIAERFAKLAFTADGHDFTLTVSIGVAALGWFNAGEAALEAADQALYQRKSEGRNGVTFYGG
jgi:diguanylate cyclase (GGDEF)-like protein